MTEGCDSVEAKRKDREIVRGWLSMGYSWMGKNNRTFRVGSGWDECFLFLIYLFWHTELRCRPPSVMAVVFGSSPVPFT